MTSPTQPRGKRGRFGSRGVPEFREVRAAEMSAEEIGRRRGTLVGLFVRWIDEDERAAEAAAEAARAEALREARNARRRARRAEARGANRLDASSIASPSQEGR